MTHTIHVLPIGPRSGPDHRIGASRCGCDPLAAEVIGEGPSGPTVWIHRPMYELAESRVQSERLDPATGSASPPRPDSGRPGGGGGPKRSHLHGPFASPTHAGTSSTLSVTDPFCAPSKVQP